MPLMRAAKSLKYNIMHLIAAHGYETCHCLEGKMWKRKYLHARLVCNFMSTVLS
jgi:hypothetical protein